MTYKSLLLAALLCTPAAKGTRRVQVFSDDFEKEFSRAWQRKGNLPENSAWFAGTPKRGKHAVRQMGSRVTDENDLDCYVQRIVSTVGYHDIQISLQMGTSGMDSPREQLRFFWADQGFGSPHGHWFLLKDIKGGDVENDGELHHFSFSLPPAADNNPKFVLFFEIAGTDAADDSAYVDDIVVTGQGPAGGRATIHSEDFEGGFPGAWDRKGNLPNNTSLFSGAPRHGAHSMQLLGSPAGGGDEFDAYVQREISTARYHDIQVSFDMGASGLHNPTEKITFIWACQGFATPSGHWHELKGIKGGDAENDGKLHHFSFTLPAEANDNPKFLLFFGINGTDSAEDLGFVDNIVITGGS